ncbi:MAG: thiamine ABC transporter substrate binding subunit [Reinekea sp.]
MFKQLTVGLSVALSASVIAKPITIYTYESFVSEWGPGPALEEDGVALLNRLRLEGDQTQADVVLGLDDGLLAEAKKLNLLAEHKQNLDGLSLPYQWNDDTFVPYDYGHFAFIYDRQRTEQVPTSLKQLVEDSDLSIIYQDPRISTPGQGLMLWIKSVYGDKADAAWQQLKEKTVTVTPGWSEAYALFLDGKSDMVLSYTTSPAYHVTWDETDQYQAAEFSEGHYVQIELAAALKTSDNLDQARDFLHFLTTKPAQDVFAGTNWMWPVLADADKPDAFAQVIKPKTLHFSSDEVAENRRAWIKEWRNATSQ